MRLFVVSNMYPDKKHPTYGIFVKNFCDELDRANVPYLKSTMIKRDSAMGKIWGYIIFYLQTIYKLLTEKYDVVYVHYASHSSIPVLIANKVRKSVIYTNLHGSDVVPENSRQKKMQKYTARILKLSKRIIVPSEYFKNYVIQKYNPCCEILVYPSAGINPAIFKLISDNNIKTELKKKFDINSQIPVFGMAGRISAGKGWDTFIQAVALLKAQNVSAVYIIVGNGPEEKKMLKLINDLELTDDIILIDLLPQRKLAYFFNILDFFVFPTKREGESLGLVALEAMACGTPVISSDFAAPDYYVVNGYNGYKFSMDNPKSLARIIMQCCTLSKESIMNELREGAQKTASAYYIDHIRVKFYGVIA